MVDILLLSLIGILTHLQGYGVGCSCGVDSVHLDGLRLRLLYSLKLHRLRKNLRINTNIDTNVIDVS